ncbi:MAG: hypothetical protein ACXVEF_13755 [Polyangiales bacterium]
MKRSVRFVRALALSCAAVSCAGKVSPEPKEETKTDAAADSASVDAPTTGLCVGPGTSAGLDCAAGGACVWDITNGTPTCRFDTIGSTPCGAIACGTDCTCSSASVCTCNGPVAGPLSPPDLASV